jgi:hypothetical protein
MDEEQQIPKPVESKDKSGTDPEELAYQKKYEKYLKQKERYEYYLKNKTRLDELKNNIADGKFPFSNKLLYDENYIKYKDNNWNKLIKEIWWMSINDALRLKLMNGDWLPLYFKKELRKDSEFMKYYTKKDFDHWISFKLNRVFVYHISNGFYEFYTDLSLSFPKKPILPKKPIKKEIQPEIETLKTQVQLATLSKSIGSKEFLIWWELVEKNVFDLYSQYKKDRMIPSDQTWWTAPKPWTPEKYQNLSWEYFKKNILNKDERYTVR